MKTTIRNTALMTSLAVAGMCAHAEGFNFYALLDGGIAHSSISSGGGSKTEFVTGGYAPNFFGMKAEKTMGQGYSAGFNLEQGFLLNKPNGAANNGYEANSRFAFGGDSLFNRQANLYLTSSKGTLKAGTQSNVVFDSLVASDPRFGSNYASALATVVADGGLNTTDDGAVSFTFPAVAGITTTVAYVGQANSGSTMKSGERVAFNYAADGLKATLGYYNNEGTTTGASSAAAHGYVLGNLWGEPHDARACIQHLKAHRLKREAKIWGVMQQHPEASMDDWVQLAYDDVPPRLWPVAMRSLLAHVERLRSLV